jgi:predicted nucleotidyltransferase
VTPAFPVGRDRIIATLAAALESERWTLAAWLGGSDATGRTDEYSDVDLVAIVEDDRVDDAFDRVTAALESLSPIATRHRMPDPTWHGHAQMFAALRDASPHHFVDFVAMKRSATDRFLESERHGDPVVLFDRDGRIRSDPFDRKAHAERLRSRWEALRETFPMFQPLTLRALARGHVAEAAYWYVNMGLKPLVELLRMRHCPDRFDFGLRYLDRDVPPDVRERIERLAFAADPGALARRRGELEAWFVEEVAAHDRGEWSLPDAAGEAVSG